MTPIENIKRAHGTLRRILDEQEFLSPTMIRGYVLDVSLRIEASIKQLEDGLPHNNLKGQAVALDALYEGMEGRKENVAKN